MKTFPSVGRYLREVREREGYSLREVADHVGIHHSALGRFELGEASLSAVTVGKLRNYLVPAGEMGRFIEALLQDVPAYAPIGAVLEAELYRVLPHDVGVARVTQGWPRADDDRDREIWDYVVDLEDGSRWFVDVKVRRRREQRRRRAR